MLGVQVVLITLLGTNVKICQDFMNQNQHIEVVISKQSESVCDLNRRRLTTSLYCIRYLLKQGLSFRGHDEVRQVVLENAPQNQQMIAPSIQKEIVNAASLETTKVILSDLGDELFAILVDESRDVSNKVQMTVVLRYVNEHGSIIESFLGIVHVTSTTTVTLKAAIQDLFCKFGLNPSRICGQGYDGARNMQGEFGGLKSLILKENSYAFYIHCFAHQLQLTLVAIAKDRLQVCRVFNLVSTLTNVVGGSCKRQDMLRENQIKNVKKAL